MENFVHIAARELADNRDLSGGAAHSPDQPAQFRIEPRVCFCATLHNVAVGNKCYPLSRPILDRTNVSCQAFFLGSR